MGFPIGSVEYRNISDKLQPRRDRDDFDNARFLRSDFCAHPGCDGSTKQRKSRRSRVRRKERDAGSQERPFESRQPDHPDRQRPGAGVGRRGLDPLPLDGHRRKPGPLLRHFRLNADVNFSTESGLHV